MHYLFYKVRKDDIAMIKHLLESYENIFQLSTVDDSIPKIQISIAPDFVDEVQPVLRDMEERFGMQKLDEDSSKSQGNY